MKNFRNSFIPVLIVITIISLFFGIWGVYQIGWENGLNARANQYEPALNGNSDETLNPGPTNDPVVRDYWPWPMRERYNWHWPIGGVFLVFIGFMILGMIGCFIFSRFVWRGRPRMPWCMPGYMFGWHGYRRWHGGRGYHHWDGKYHDHDFTGGEKDGSDLHHQPNRSNPQANPTNNHDQRD